MGRGFLLKILTLVFSLITVISLGACAVASVPTSNSGGSDRTETATETVEPDPTPEIEVSEPEPTAVPDEPEPQDDSEATDDDDSSAIEPAGDDDAQDVEIAEAEASYGDPVRLQIDSIDVDAPFEYVGVTDEGDMDVPQEWDNVAWYEPGTVPGDPGNAVVAGHYDSDTGPAVFIDLNEVAAGDEIRIITEDDEELIFEITQVELVHVDDADTSKIFGGTDERNLNLITCEGAWDPDAGMYDERLIVYSTLVSDD